MRIIQILFGILLIIPVGLTIYSLFINPIGYERNSLRELAFLACGMPILFINIFLWVFPKEMKYYILGKR